MGRQRTASDKPFDGSAIRHLALFRDLDARAIDDIAQMARPHRLPPGETVFRQGDSADAISLVLSGRFKAMQINNEGARIVTRLAGPGDVMGHVAAFNDESHPATPIAVIDSVVLTWPADIFIELMHRHPTFAMAIIRSMGKSIQEAHTRLQEASTERAERRIAHAVMRLARQAGRSIEGGVEIAFPVTRQDIALMTGATLHTVSRTLRAWEHQGIVDGGRQHLILRDAQALMRIAKGG